MPTTIKPGQLFIDGKFQPAKSGKTFTTINPATEDVITTVADGGPEDVDAAVRAARKAFDEGPWPKLPASERGRMVWKLADLLEANIDDMAERETLDTGKTLFDSRKIEMPFAAGVFRYYAGWAGKTHGETLPLRDDAFTFTLREPMGVVAAITPWNFPFLLAAWKIAPAL